MSKRNFFIASILTFFAVGSVMAEDTAGAGFVDLLNEKDFSGWTTSEENTDSYSMKDGIMIVKGGRSHLFYTGDVNGGNFKNFELKVRAKTFPGANSGVFFHTKFQKEGWPEHGYECQINSTQKDPKKTGSLYSVKNIIVLKEGQKEPKGDNDVRDKAPSTDGEWFEYHIKVVGKHVTLKVDGETTVDYVEPEGGSSSVPKFKNRRLSEGTFAIQAHDPDSEVHYDYIRVKVLP